MNRPWLMALSLAGALWLGPGCAGCGDEDRPIRSNGSTCTGSGQCQSELCHYQTCVVPEADDDQDGLLNTVEAIAGTNPHEADTDNDGLGDYVEVGAAFRKSIAKVDLHDQDTDGTINALESFLCDTDCDGQSDESDQANSLPMTETDQPGGCQPTCPASERPEIDDDGDGVVNAEDNCHLVASDDVTNTDGDLQGDICDEDDDEDGLSDAEETTLGTDPLSEDSDGDGLSDLEEVEETETDPTDADSDGDGVNDGDQVQKEEAPDQDPDGDGYDSIDDCKPLDPESYPGAEETCDGVDNDCDGQIDVAPGLCDDSVDCTTDTCTGTAGCLNAPEDGLCPESGAPCTTPACDPAAGCVFSPTTGAACDDGDLCTTGDICDDGACVAPGAMDCDDEVDCTTDACDPAEGCLNTPNDDACVDDDDPCTGVVCEPGEGCVSIPVEAECDDGDLCTSQDTCQSGVCQPGTPTVCDPTGNPCLSVYCEPTSGGCFHEPNQDPCDDDDPCTVTSQCAGAECVGTETLVCDDEIPCTTDACDPVTGACVFQPQDSACDNGLYCDGSETCDAVEGCQSGTAPTVDDGVDCTTDDCDEATDAVTHTPDDTQCDNGLFCDGEETCDAVDGCQPGATPATDDGLDCTTDACDEDGDAVTNTPDDAQCDDGVECTVDSCDPINGCQFTPADGGCDDGVECTIDSCDPILGCTSVPDDGLCDDGLDCTTDTCVVGGCQNAVPTPTPTDCCSSDDQCVTEGKCTYGYCETGTHTCVSAQDVTSFGCVQGNCSGPAQCDDGDPCTFDSCDNGEGAVGQCIPPLNLGPCISDVPCDPDAEDGGVADCDDDNPCTLDACDETSSLCRNTALPPHATLDGGELPCGQEGMYCVDGECEVGCGGMDATIDEEFGDADDQQDIGGEGEPTWTEHLQGAPGRWVLTQGLPSGQHPEPNALTFQVFDTDIGDQLLSVLELTAGSILSKRPSEGTMADFDYTVEVRVTSETPGAADPHLSLQCWRPLGPGQGPDTDTGALVEIKVPVSQPAEVVQGAFSETSFSPATLGVDQWHYLRVRRHSYDGTVSAWLGDEELFSNAGPEDAGPVEECYLYLAAVGVDLHVNEILAAHGSQSGGGVGFADTLDCTSPKPGLPSFIDPSSGQCRYDDSDPDYGPYFCQWSG